MGSKLIKALIIFILISLFTTFVSVNLGALFDAGSWENARAYMIVFAIVILTGVIASCTYLIIKTIKEVHSK